MTANVITNTPNKVGTMSNKTQLPWNAAKPYDGLGWRTVRATASGAAQQMREHNIG